MVVVMVVVMVVEIIVTPPYISCSVVGCGGIDGCGYGCGYGSGDNCYTSLYLMLSSGVRGDRWL